MMDSQEKNRTHLPFGLIPTPSTKVGQNASHSSRVDEYKKECKRERERERFASMSKERRDELNKKRRESYQRRKVGQKMCGSHLEVINPIIRRNQRDRARRASMPPEKREEMNKKRRESYKRKKGQSKLLETKNGCDIPINKENEDPANNGEWLNRNNSHLHHNDGCGNIPTTLPAASPQMLREKKCAYSREWYKNMPFEQKKARQERERLYNATTRRQEAKGASKRRRNELRANTLHPDSIAMENPLYIYHGQ